MPFALNFVHPLLMWVLLGLMLYSGYLGYKASLIRKVSAEERKAMVPLHYGQRHAQFGAVILGLTPFGRATYAIGANEVAARFSGIRVNATKLWIYTAAGFCSALAAVIFVSRVTTTRSDMGTGLELDAITAVVLGGTSIFGGRGTIIGTALGLILIQALKNGLALSGVKGDGTIVVIGLVLIGAILVGALFDKNRGG